MASVEHGNPSTGDAGTETGVGPAWRGPVPAMAYAPLIMSARFSSGILIVGLCGWAAAVWLGVTIGPAWSLGWAGIIALIFMAMMVLGRRSTEDGGSILAILWTWRARHRWLTLLLGLGWGAGAVLVAPALAPGDATVFLLVLTITAGAMTLFAVGDRAQIAALSAPTLVAASLVQLFGKEGLAPVFLILVLGLAPLTLALGATLLCETAARESLKRDRPA